VPVSFYDCTSRLSASEIREYAFIAFNVSRRATRATGYAAHCDEMGEMPRRYETIVPRV
jgi:hypothetical protein